jgi:arylsulfatase
MRSWFGASGAPGLLPRFMPRLGALALVALQVGWQAGWAPVLAQTISGTLGAPDATTTLSGNQLPAPAPPFGGVIKDAALQSRPWWAPRITPPQSAPNVLLIITDDAGFGVPSTFGGVIPTPAMERDARNGLR